MQELSSCTHTQTTFRALVARAGPVGVLVEARRACHALARSLGPNERASLARVALRVPDGEGVLGVRRHGHQQQDGSCHAHCRQEVVDPWAHCGCVQHAAAAATLDTHGDAWHRESLNKYQSFTTLFINTRHGFDFLLFLLSLPPEDALPCFLLVVSSCSCSSSSCSSPFLAAAWDDALDPAAAKGSQEGTSCRLAQRLRLRAPINPSEPAPPEPAAAAAAAANML